MQGPTSQCASCFADHKLSRSATAPGVRVRVQVTATQSCSALVSTPSWCPSAKYLRRAMRRTCWPASSSTTPRPSGLRRGPTSSDFRAPHHPRTASPPSADSEAVRAAGGGRGGGGGVVSDVSADSAAVVSGISRRFADAPAIELMLLVALLAALLVLLARHCTLAFCPRPHLRRYLHPTP